MRRLLLSILVGLFLLSPLRAAEGDKALPEITVFKSPTCGCCAKWATHLRENGFSVKEINARSMAEVKQSAGVGKTLRSCHTAFLKASDDPEARVYVIEGHVPGREVKRLLTEKPDIKGLAVPGMPLGSPGMEQADGTEDEYNVLSFDKTGKTKVFERYRGNKRTAPESLQ